MIFPTPCPLKGGDEFIYYSYPALHATENLSQFPFQGAGVREIWFALLLDDDKCCLAKHTIRLLVSIAIYRFCQLHLSLTSYPLFHFSTVRFPSPTISKDHFQFERNTLLHSTY